MHLNICLSNESLLDASGQTAPALKGCMILCVCVYVWWGGEGVEESKSTNTFTEECECPRDALLWEYQVISSDVGAASGPRRKHPAGGCQGTGFEVWQTWI